MFMKNVAVTFCFRWKKVLVIMGY